MINTFLKFIIIKFVWDFFHFHKKINLLLILDLTLNVPPISFFNYSFFITYSGKWRQ